MNAILTIEDLALAQATNTGLVDECFSMVTVEKDLEEYLLWLYQDEVEVTVTSTLNRSRKRSLGLHPSSACKNKVCLLKLYYECTGEIEPHRAYSQRDHLTWDTGTLLHDTFQGHFKEMYGEQFEDEVKLVDDELHLKSRTDGIFSFTRVRFVLEAKSIKEAGNFGWEKVQKKPMKDNVRQSYFYMFMADVPFALIFYMNKNAGLFKEHAVMFDQEVWDEIVKEIVQPVVEAAYNEGQMVPATPGYGCRWCDYNYRCKAASKEKAHVKGSSKPWGKR